jgi:hypothetical protein
MRRCVVSDSSMRVAAVAAAAAFPFSSEVQRASWTSCRLLLVPAACLTVAGSTYQSWTLTKQKWSFLSHQLWFTIPTTFSPLTSKEDRSKKHGIPQEGFLNRCWSGAGSGGIITAWFRWICTCLLQVADDDFFLDLLCGWKHRCGLD